MKCQRYNWQIVWAEAIPVDLQWNGASVCYNKVWDSDLSNVDVTSSY